MKSALKKFTIIVLTTLFFCSMAFPVIAETEEIEDDTIDVAEEIEDKTTTISLTIGSLVMETNGKIQQLDTAPMIQNGRTMVPVKAISEALSAEVTWDGKTRTVTATRGNAEIKLTIGNHITYKNNSSLYIDAAPLIVNERTMVPLRFIAESFGADVNWNPETKTITITHIPKFVEIGDAKIYIGDILAQAENMLGDADRIDPSLFDFNWHVYNSDYSRFIMVGIKNDIVEALYTNCKGFETNDAKYGDTGVQGGSNIVLYFDRHNSSRLHACLIISGDVRRKDYEGYGNDFFRAQEMEAFDATNVFRVNHGMAPLKLDDIATLTARKHSQDMADRNYFSHNTPEGLSPTGRYKKNGGNHACGENIAAGILLGIDTFDAWVNSKDHRSNMLRGQYTYLGVGFGYKATCRYDYYMTQLFVEH